MSFPNPAMLPFFAAGGAISGSSFGLFYTILMQVGYNYYGKRVLKGLNEGGDLKQLLWEVQQEIQPFSDAMMQTALDALPSVVERSMDAFAGVIEKTGGHVASELAKSWLLPHPEGGGFGSLDDLFKFLKGTPSENIPDWLKAGGVHPPDKVIDTTKNDDFTTEEQLAELQKKGGIIFKDTTKDLINKEEHRLRQIFGNKSRQSLQIHYREQSALVKKLSLQLASMPTTKKVFAQKQTKWDGRRYVTTDVFHNIQNPAIPAMKNRIGLVQQRITDIIAYFKFRNWSF